MHFHKQFGDIQKRHFKITLLITSCLLSSDNIDKTGCSFHLCCLARTSAKCCHLIECEGAPKPHSQWNTNTAVIFAVFCIHDCLRSKVCDMVEPKNTSETEKSHRNFFFFQDELLMHLLLPPILPLGQSFSQYAWGKSSFSLCAITTRNFKDVWHSLR